MYYITTIQIITVIDLFDEQNAVNFPVNSQISRELGLVLH